MSKYVGCVGSGRSVCTMLKQIAELEGLPQITCINVESKVERDKKLLQSVDNVDRKVFYDDNKRFQCRAESVFIGAFDK